ncbi:MAG: hypothetical protein UMU75_07735 [Halomonas sp.]|nr:hypothetical protein [Halomonas sp.]
MTDMTIDQLQADNEALKAKNAELLDELKKAKASRAKEGLQEKIDALEAENSALKKDMHEIKTRDGWEAVFSNTGVAPGMDKFLRQEMIERGFSLGFDEDGEMVFLNSEGQPIPEVIELENGYLKQTGKNLSPMNREHAMKVTDPIRDQHPSLWPVPKGSGAPGSTGRAFTRNPEPTPEPKKQESAPQFGMK